MSFKTHNSKKNQRIFLSQYTDKKRQNDLCRQVTSCRSTKPDQKDKHKLGRITHSAIVKGQWITRWHCAAGHTGESRTKLDSRRDNRRHTLPDSEMSDEKMMAWPSPLGKRLLPRLPTADISHFLPCVFLCGCVNEEIEWPKTNKQKVIFFKEELGRSHRKNPTRQTTIHPVPY